MDYLKNWKTSLGGILALAVAGAELSGVTVPGIKENPSDLLTIAFQAIIGGSLIAAKDAK